MTIYHTVYQTTNLVNNKIYVGVHSTSDPYDSYLGSGRYFNNAIKKYGEDNFKKTVLFIFDTPEEAYAKEVEIVNEEFLKRDDVYNIKPGGQGGWDYVNSTDKNIYPGHLEQAKKNFKFAQAEFQRLLKEDVDFNLKYRKTLSKSLKERYKHHTHHWVGRAHTEKTKQLIGSKSAVHQAGTKNSQYGTMWINNGAINQKIKSGGPIPNGWVKGAVFPPKLKSPIRCGEKLVNEKAQIPVRCYPDAIRTEIKIISKTGMTVIEEKGSQLNEALYWYNQLITTPHTSIRNFVKNSDYPYSHVSFMKLMNRYINGFNAKNPFPYVEM